MKKGVLKDFPIYTGKHLCWSLFNKFAALNVFSCEYCEHFKKTYLDEHLRATAYVSRVKSNFDSWIPLTFLTSVLNSVGHVPSWVSCHRVFVGPKIFLVGISWV